MTENFSLKRFWNYILPKALKREPQKRSCRPIVEHNLYFFFKRLSKFRNNVRQTVESSADIVDVWKSQIYINLTCFLTSGWKFRILRVKYMFIYWNLWIMIFILNSRAIFGRIFTEHMIMNSCRNIESANDWGCKQKISTNAAKCLSKCNTTKTTECANAP